MTISASAPLQEAIYAALMADEVLVSALAGIYDQAPADTVYPFLALGETSVTPGNLKDTEGARIEFDVLIYSDEPSQMQVKELMATTERTLSAAEITLTDYDLVSLDLVSAAISDTYVNTGKVFLARLHYSSLIFQRL